MDTIREQHNTQILHRISPNRSTCKSHVPVTALAEMSPGGTTSY
jgi:hypothetical protein